MLFGLLFFVFVFLIWGRWRYDLVAFIALLVALLTGIVPKELAFSGFGHPATIIIALVLIVSRGLSNSGAIELVARHIVDASRKLGTHITIMSGLAAGLSALASQIHDARGPVGRQHQHQREHVHPVPRGDEESRA